MSKQDWTQSQYYQEDFLARHSVQPGSGEARKRRGKEDDRYLWPEMLRVISEIRPHWVVGENVAGIVSMVESKSNVGVEGRNISVQKDEIHYEATWVQQENMLFVELIESLERIGYEVQPLIIPACAVDAPHRRDRTAILAHANADGCAWTGIQPSEGCNGDKEHSSVAKGCNVPDADRQRFQVPGHGPGFRAIQPENGIELSGWWPAEPDVGRMAHGVPARVDRLKCLGNAVVPQQFYPIFAGIAELEGMYGNP